MPKQITKNRIICLQLKAVKQKRKFKKYTKYQNREIRKRLAKTKRIRPISKSISDLKRLNLTLPKIFSVNEDIESAMKFIYDCKKSLERKNFTNVDFDFSDVELVDDGAITLLLSVCYDISSKGINVRTNFPRNIQAKNFLQKSGFIQFFRGPHQKKRDDLLNVTIKKGKSKIEQKDSAKLIHKAMKTVFRNDEQVRNQRLQGMLIELMTNSVNHAYLDSTKEKTWYLSTNHYLEQNKVEFCFVDNGDGIINTINIKFKEKYFSSNEELLVKAFDGEFRSRTKLANRGRGLIAIKNGNEQMTIRGLRVITNNVFLDFESGKVKKIKNSFSGTFYSWILDTSCK